MIRIDLEIFDDVVTAITKIRGSNETEINLYIPEGSVLFDNIISLKLILRDTGLLEKRIQFFTEDVVGKRLISKVLNESLGDNVDLDSVESEEEELLGSDSFELGKKVRIGFAVPLLSLFSGASAVLSRINFKLFVVVAVLLTGLLTLGYFFLSNSPSVDIELRVESTPLVRSLQAKIDSEVSTSKDSKVFKGEGVSTTISDTITVTTSGEKTVGDKASGEITIYNKTDADISLKKGDIVEFAEDNLKFVINNGVVVPARTEKEPDPENPLEQVFILGEAEASVTASEIGSKYNLSKNKEMEFEKHKKASLVARSKNDFTGGSSKKVKVVSEKDLEEAKASLTKKMEDQVVGALSAAVSGNLVLIEESRSVVQISEDFSAKIDEEKDELVYNRAVSVSGLAYDKILLNEFLAGFMQDFLPQDTMMWGDDIDVKLEILGNTPNTVLTSKEADVQVTLSTRVVPTFDSDKLKETMAGKPYSEVESILSSMRNYKGHSISQAKGLNISKKLPKNVESINLDIKKL